MAEGAKPSFAGLVQAARPAQAQAEPALRSPAGTGDVGVGTSHPLTDSASPAAPASSTPASRWKAAASKATTGMAFARLKRRGPLTEGPATIDVVDYSAARVAVQNLNKAQLSRWLNEERPAWSRVRWINVNGLSWDVVRTLTESFDLHPLAVEDTMHVGDHVSRPKTDFYESQLFLNLALHSVSEGSPGNVEGQPDPAAGGPDDGTQLRRAATRSEVARHTIRQLTNDMKLHINSSQLNLFLMRDGTVISIWHDEQLRAMDPLLERLRNQNSLLRLTEDPSMLLHAIVDVVIESAVEISEAFRKELTLLEEQTLVQTNVKLIRHTHVLSSELLLLKRTLQPLPAVVRNLQNHQSHDAYCVPAHHSQHHDHHLRRHSSSATLGPDGLKTPFISKAAEVYLSDTAEQCEAMLGSFDLFAELATNLVGFSFNAVSYTMNESMVQMTTVTIIFLPLTFLSGYFGQNFDVFEGVKDPGDSVWLFWAIAAPMLVIVTGLLGFPYIRHLVQVLNRKRIRRQSSKAPLALLSHRKTL